MSRILETCNKALIGTVLLLLLLLLLLLYYFNNTGLQVSPTYKGQRSRFSLINRYVPYNMNFMDFKFFCNFV
jgi:hypothetical protein